MPHKESAAIKHISTEKGERKSAIEPAVMVEQDAASYIGMSVAYLRQSRMNGNRDGRTPAPPWISIGRSIRYRRDDLDSWLTTRRVG